MSPTTRLLYIVSGSLLIVGLVAGFMPLSSMGTACGSAFLPERFVVSFGVQDCSGTTSMMAVPAWGLSILGFVLGVGAMYSHSVVDDPARKQQAGDLEQRG